MNMRMERLRRSTGKEKMAQLEATKARRAGGWSGMRRRMERMPTTERMTMRHVRVTHLRREVGRGESGLLAGERVLVGGGGRAATTLALVAAGGAASSARRRSARAPAREADEVEVAVPPALPLVEVLRRHDEHRERAADEERGDEADELVRLADGVVGDEPLRGDDVGRRAGSGRRVRGRGDSANE